MKVVLVLALLALCVFAQSKTDLLIIDDFQSGLQTIIIEIPANNNSLPITMTDFASPSGNNVNILGGERDLELVVQTGAPNLILTAQILTGQFAVSTPNGASGFSTVQWDGKDNSINLNSQGLGGIDFTFSGNAAELRATLDSDHATTFTITVVSMDGKQCVLELDVAEGSAAKDYTASYKDFSGNCDFTNVGAIEVTIDASLAVDADMELFSVFGVVPATPTPSKSHSKNPSQTRTPAGSKTPPSGTRTPTPTRTPSKNPSQSRTPSSVADCLCHCPAFTCELIFDPDDDENNAYYFDDEDNPGNGNGAGAPSGSGGGKAPSGNGNGNGGKPVRIKSSDAGALSVSIVTLFVALFFNMF